MGHLLVFHNIIYHYRRQYIYFCVYLIWYYFFVFRTYELDVLVLYIFVLCLFGMKLYRQNAEDVSCVYMYFMILFKLSE